MGYIHLTNWHGDTEEDFSLFRGHLTREQCEALLPDQEIDPDHWDGAEMYHGYARNVPVSEAECGEAGLRQIMFYPQARGAFKVTVLGTPTYVGNKYLTPTTPNPENDDE